MGLTLGRARFVEDEFTAAGAQTVFALTESFRENGISVLTVNGVAYAETTDYTIVGTVLTWLDTPFALQAGETVIVKYQRA